MLALRVIGHVDQNEASTYRHTDWLTLLIGYRVSWWAISAWCWWGRWWPILDVVSLWLCKSKGFHNFFMRVHEEILHLHFRVNQKPRNGYLKGMTFSIHFHLKISGWHCGSTENVFKMRGFVTESSSLEVQLSWRNSFLSWMIWKKNNGNFNEPYFQQGSGVDNGPTFKVLKLVQKVWLLVHSGFILFSPIQVEPILCNIYCPKLLISGYLWYFTFSGHCHSLFIQINLTKGSWGQFWPQRSKTRYYFLIAWT